MKNFVKLFFTVVLFFLSLTGVSAGDLACNNEFCSIVATPQADVHVQPVNSEKYIVSVNNNSLEMFSATQKRNSDFSGSLDRVSAQNKSLNNLFSFKYNKLNILSQADKSTHLSYEICTRAP